jgi:hypothetical protein
MTRSGLHAPRVARVAVLATLLAVIGLLPISTTVSAGSKYAPQWFAKEVLSRLKQMQYPGHLDPGRKWTFADLQSAVQYAATNSI